MSERAILDRSEMGVMPSVSVGKFGMWIFLVSEIMFFAGLIGSYLVLRFGAQDWPLPADTLSLPLLTINTLVLITSSLTMAFSVDAAEKGNQANLVKYLSLTALLGTAFLGIKAYDYVHMWSTGFTMSAHMFGGAYYLITAFHGLHVLAGIILLLNLIVGARKGIYTKEKHVRVECAGLYWHFVDVVWVVVFAALCLL